MQEDGLREASPLQVSDSVNNASKSGFHGICLHNAIKKGGDIMKIIKKGCKNPASVHAMACCTMGPKLRSGAAPDEKRAK